MPADEKQAYFEECIVDDIFFLKRSILELDCINWLHNCESKDGAVLYIVLFGSQLSYDYIEAGL